MNKKERKATAFLSLGSNIGDRMAYLAAAVEKLTNNADVEIIKQSQVYETEPWPHHEAEDVKHVRPKEEDGQEWFLNQVLKIETTLNPQDLLAIAQTIEQDLGRSKVGDKWGPRKIDVDILLYGNEIIDIPKLQIPHRHMNDRQFILVPLVEIEPRLKDPLTQKTYQHILKNIKDDHKVIPFF